MTSNLDHVPMEYYIIEDFKKTGKYTMYSFFGNFKAYLSPIPLAQASEVCLINFPIPVACNIVVNNVNNIDIAINNSKSYSVTSINITKNYNISIEIFPCDPKIINHERGNYGIYVVVTCPNL